jgi:hypothetical protein
MCARARAGAHQNVEVKIFQRRVEHLLDVRQKAVNLVDKENLARLDRAQDAREVELLRQNGSGGLLERDVEFLGDDRGESRFTQAGRAVEQHVIHGFAALAGGLDGDAQIFLETLLAGEINQAPGAQSNFKLALFFVFSS